MPKDASLQSQTIEWLRFVLAAAVVMIHTSMPSFVEFQPFAQQSVSSFVYYLFSCGLCNAAVPTFFFISGYLFFTKLHVWDYRIYKQKMAKRVWSIAIPYVLWIIIGLLFNAGLPILRHTLSGGDTFSDAISNFGDYIGQRGYLRVFWDCNRLGENPLKLNNIIGVPMHHMYPYVTPLWFLRDLMVVMVFSPVVYAMVKYCKKWGFIIVGILMAFNIWIPLEGFNVRCFFFFSLGAYFQIYDKDFICAFRKFEIPAYILAALLLFTSMAMYGVRDNFSRISTYMYIVFGVISTINIAGRLLEKGLVKVRPFLSETSFFIFAAHTIMITMICTQLMNRILPGSNQVVLTISYFSRVGLAVVLCVTLYWILEKMCPRVLSILTGGR